MISGLFTIAAIIGFTGVVWWACARRNRERFHEASLLPLDDEPLSAVPATGAAELPPCCRRAGS